MRRLFALLTLPLLLNGCVGALVSTGATVGESVAENRSIGRKVDDTVIYTDLTNRFIQADQAKLLAKVTFNVRYARVMLTGNVPTQDDAMKAAELSWQAKGVSEVINELVVNPDASVMSVANDTLAKRNLEARLLITKGVWVINYSIDVQNGVAYLIGRVKDQAELDRVFNVARSTKGIKRVVSHLQINPDTAQPTSDPANPNSTISNSSKALPSSAPYPTGSTAPVGNVGNSASDVYTGPVYSGGSISSKSN